MKKINYDDILKRTTELLNKSKGRGIILLDTDRPNDNGKYKIEESNTKKIKTLYFDTLEEKKLYIQKLKETKECHIIKICVID